MWTLIIIIIIIVVVVVVDDDTYYWVYLSSNHLFQVYYKVRQVLLQSATAFFITKCDGLLLQSATAFLLQSATRFITNCDRYSWNCDELTIEQIATGAANCDSTSNPIATLLWLFQIARLATKWVAAHFLAFFTTLSYW